MKRSEAEAEERARSRAASEVKGRNGGDAMVKEEIKEVVGMDVVSAPAPVLRCPALEEAKVG